MACGRCATRVEEALNSTDEVRVVTVSHEREKAVIKYDDKKITVNKLREAIRSTGFIVSLIQQSLWDYLPNIFNKRSG
jgi:copper chaperone